MSTVLGNLRFIRDKAGGQVDAVIEDPKRVAVVLHDIRLLAEEAIGICSLSEPVDDVSPGFKPDPGVDKLPSNKCYPTWRQFLHSLSDCGLNLQGEALEQLENMASQADCFANPDK